MYPFEVSLGQWVLFSGQDNNLFSTTILANLDRAFLPIFARGFLRATGPAGVVGILGAGLWGLVRCVGVFGFGSRGVDSDFNEQNDLTVSTSPTGHFNAILLCIWTFTFLITPFSDHNGTTVHNLLYSGGTIRLAFPAILLLVWMGSKPLVEWVEKVADRKLWIMAILAGTALVNLFWYDAVCLFAKPENALAWVAPVAKSFNNWVLGCWVLGTGVLCALVVLTKKRWLWGLLVIGAIAVQQGGYPESLGYTMRFKQIGQSSRVFEFLEQQGFSKQDTVAVHSADESSFFLACVNDYLLPRAGRMFYVDELNASDAPTPPDPHTPIRPFGAAAPEWLVLCAKDTFELNDRVYGKHYTASWRFLDGKRLPMGYEEVFRDNFYRVYKFLRES